MAAVAIGARIQPERAILEKAGPTVQVDRTIVHQGKPESA